MRHTVADRSWHPSTLALWNLAAACASYPTTSAASVRSAPATLARELFRAPAASLAAHWPKLPLRLRAFALAAASLGRGDAFRRSLVRALVEPWWRDALGVVDGLSTTDARDLIAPLADVLAWTARERRRSVDDWEAESVFCGESADVLDDAERPIAASLWRAASDGCALVSYLQQGCARLAGDHAARLAMNAHADALDVYSHVDVEHLRYDRWARGALFAAGLSEFGDVDAYVEAAGDPISAWGFFVADVHPTRIVDLRVQGIDADVLRESFHAASARDFEPFVGSLVRLNDGITSHYHATPWGLVAALDCCILDAVRRDRMSLASANFTQSQGGAR